MTTDTTDSSGTAVWTVSLVWGNAHRGLQAGQCRSLQMLCEEAACGRWVRGQIQGAWMAELGGCSLDQG